MKLSEFLGAKDNLPTKQGNPSVKCNTLSKTQKSFNCQMTPTQAIELARHLLQKAQLLLKNQVEDGTVQLWNVGTNSETLSLGLMPARKGPRRKKIEPGASADK